MKLTKNGKMLYNQLKPIVDELERIEKSFETKRNIKLGTYNKLALFIIVLKKIVSNI